jgi:hypothetical protein
VFKVIDALGLILVPHTGYEQSDTYWWSRSFGKVQLFDFDRATLTRRASVRQNGYTERALTLPGNKLVALSNEVLDVLDISNRDLPALVGTLELARNVYDIAVSGDVAVEYVGDFQQHNTKLYVVPASDPNTTTPLGVVDFPRPYGRMLKNGSFTYVVSNETYSGRSDATTGQPEMLPAALTVVDISTPTAPRVRGSLELPSNVGGGGCYGGYYGGDVAPGGYGGGYYGGCGGTEVVQMDGGFIAMHQQGYCRQWDAMYQNCTDREPHRIVIADLSNPDAPAIASSTSYDDVDWMYGLSAQGRMLYVSHYRSFVRNDQYFARYYLGRIDATNPAAPVLLPNVNIPGQFLGATADNRIIHTVENWYDYDQRTGNGTQHTLVHALDLENDTAYLRSSLEVNGYLAGLTYAAGGFAYATLQTYEPNTGTSRNQLLSFDLRNADSLRVAAQRLDQDNGYGYYWWGGVTVAGSRLFLSGGDGVAVFSLENGLAPRFADYHRTRGYGYGGTGIIIDADRAFLPSGYYGVQTLPLQ